MSATLSERTVKLRLEGQVQSWRALIEGPWDPALAARQHEELDQLSQEALGADLGGVADACLDLTVFLCALIDTGSAPNATQRPVLQKRVDRLAAELGLKESRPPAPVAPANVRVAFSFAPADGGDAALHQALGQRGYAVRPFERVDRALALAREVPPDILVVDDACVGELNALLDGLGAQRDPHRPGPLCLVVADEADPSRVLFARRAGADAVVLRGQVQQALEKLDELQAQRSNSGVRVLVVDDDRSQALFCESVLHHRGIATAVCDNAGGVMDAIAEFRPDLVLLDLYLPDGNGIEVAQRIRRHPLLALLPVVFLSGEHDLDRRFDAISMGGDDFLTKPVKPRHLLATVESRVRRARQTVQAPATERRGNLVGRDVFAAETLAATRGGGTAALVWIAPDELDAVRDGLGFVAAGALQQQIAQAVTAEFALARPMCAVGDSGFLGLLRLAEAGAGHDDIEAARERLQRRSWPQLAAGDMLRFSVAVLELAPELGDFEPAWQQVKALGAEAQRRGGDRCVFDGGAARSSAADPRDRLVAALLRGTPTAESAALEFQPLIPQAGHLIGQYLVRMLLRPPGSRIGLRLQEADYLPIVQRLQLHMALDQHRVRAALEVLTGQRQGDGLRLFLPVTVASVRDAAFAPWLAAELLCREVPPVSLALVLDAAELLQARPHEAAFDALARTGVRLCLRITAVEARTRRIMAGTDYAAVQLCPGPDLDLDAAAALLQEAKTLGKIVLLGGADDAASMVALYRLQAHYVFGQAAGGWSTQPDFDFSPVTL